MTITYILIGLMFFSSLVHSLLIPFQGIIDVLCEACQSLKWKAPTKIQREAIPVALQGWL